MEDPTITEPDHSDRGLSDTHKIPEPPPPIRLLHVNPAHLPPVLEQLVLSDEQGPIPTFPVWNALDENGRFNPMPPEERQARHDAFLRAMRVINATDQDPPGSDEEFMRGIDATRPEGSKLFEGYS